MERKGDWIMRKMMPILAHLIVWAILILIFWVTPLYDDAMGYSVLALYVVMPVSTIITSFLIGRNEEWKRKKWAICVLYGALFMLFEYFTFSLANMFAESGLNAPEPSLLMIGFAFSIVAMGIAVLTQRYNRRKKS